MTATTLPLSGPRPDTLLGHLALCGTLLALDTARPAWRPRLAWSGPPWRAALHLDAEADQDAVIQAIDDGIRTIGAAYDFAGRDNITFSPAEFRAWAEERARVPQGAALAAALGSDACADDLKGETVDATLLCAINGQGHQNFLERLALLTRDPLWGNPQHLAAALLSPWTFDCGGLVFRWDANDDRRYALRFKDPAKDKLKVKLPGQKKPVDLIPTVPGANRLAAVGFLLHPTAPGGARLRTTGFSRFSDPEDGRRVVAVTWPVWTVPVGLDALRLLLNHPELVAIRPDPARLRPLGIPEVFRARRRQAGKYLSFTAGRPLWG